MTGRFVLYCLLAYSACLQGYTYPSREYENAIGRITKSYTNDLLYNEGLVLLGSGGGLTGDVKSFIYHFKSDKPLNIAEARVLIVRSVENLIRRINDDTKIRRCVPGYPFSGENIEFAVSLIQTNGYLSYVIFLDGSIGYIIRDEETGKFKTVHRETYEEARRLVREEESCTR